MNEQLVKPQLEPDVESELEPECKSEFKSVFEPEHGGNLIEASAHYGIPKSEWLDLSTGMNPNHYPVSNLPVSAFTELPYLSSAFHQAVSQYYQTDQWLAVSGSQAAIHALPAVLPNLPVLVPEIGYQEHAKAWHRASSITRYPSLDINSQTVAIDQALKNNPAQHLVVINPNNPSGVITSVQQLNHWASQLTQGAYLIVDEAFMDLTPEQSLLAPSPVPLAENVMVLRSFGKFFGLAGVRLGFVFGCSKVRAALAAEMSLWQLNGPAQALATQALSDQAWQKHAREDITYLNQCMQSFLSSQQLSYQPEVLVSQGLFISWCLPLDQGRSLVDEFAGKGVLVRLIPLSGSQSDDAEFFTARVIVRFGLLNQEQLKALIKRWAV